MIPADWDVLKLENFFKIKMGQSPPSEYYNTKQQGLPFFQGVMDFGYISPIPKVWCIESKKTAKPQEILFSVRAPVGEVNISKLKCCIGRGIAALIPINTELTYGFYLVQQFKNTFHKYIQGTTFEAINSKDIAKSLFPFTKNIKEQQKISEILSNVDDLIQNTNQQLVQTQLLKKGVMKKLFSTGINQTEFKDVVLFPKFVKVSFPESWVCNKLGKIAKFMGGFAFKSEHYVENGIFLIKIGNISHSKINWKEKQFLPLSYWDNYPEYRLEENDILMAMTRPVISSGLKVTFYENKVKSLLNQRVGKFILKDFQTGYLFQFLNLPYFINQINLRISESSQPNISSKEVENILIWYSEDPDERKQISSILSKFDIKIKNLKATKSNLELLRNGLMQKLLTGTIRVKF